MTKATLQPARGDHVLALCHMLSNRVGRAFMSELEPFGVTASEWRVMLSLASNDALSGREITARWAMDKMAVNRAIASLEARGLIEKRRNAADRRNIDLFLKPAGQELFDTLLPATNKRYHALMNCLAGAEKKQLRKILTKMIGHFDTVIE